MASRLVVVLLAGCLIASGLAAQQFRGIPASVTSMPAGTGRTFSTVGIPAGVTSITPGPTARQFTMDVDLGRRHHHHHFPKGLGGGVVFIPTYSSPYYPYGYPGFYSDDTAGMQQSDYREQPQPEPPALTIFENRPGYRPPPVERADARDYGRSDQGTAAREDRITEPEQKVVDQSPTVLVFRDGRRLEIGNYAIQGDTIFNLDGNGPRKIKLADLDLEKTIKLNDERGNEFRIPRQFRG